MSSSGRLPSCRMCCGSAMKVTAWMVPDATATSTSPPGSSRRSSPVARSATARRAACPPRDGMRRPRTCRAPAPVRGSRHDGPACPGCGRPRWHSGEQGPGPCRQRQHRNRLRRPITTRRKRKPRCHPPAGAGVAHPACSAVAPSLAPPSPGPPSLAGPRRVPPRGRLALIRARSRWDMELREEISPANARGDVCGATAARAAGCTPARPA